MGHNSNKPKYTVTIIPLNDVIMLTTERERRAERLGNRDIPIQYASFLSVCKAVEVNGNWTLVNSEDEDISRYRRIWGEPIIGVRTVVETIFTFNKDMPPSITAWKDALPYLNEGEAAALSILKEPKLHTTIEGIYRPYTDNNLNHRARLTNSSKGRILSNHVKQWAHNWGNTLSQNSYAPHYSATISPIDAIGYLVRGEVPYHLAQHKKLILSK